MNAERQTRAGFADLHPTASEIDAFRELIQRLTGLHFDDWRVGTLEKALLARMSAKGMRCMRSYLRLFEDTRQRVDEISALLDQITVNETYFLRYPAQFDFLRRSVFPALLEERSRGPLRIWSAGCSTGEEPYSIAMTALDVFGPAAPSLVRISATDVSSAALAAARRAEYRGKSLRLLDDGFRSKYFQRVSENRFLMCDGVKRMVLFMQSNLLDDARRRVTAWDVIFCRNVLIYFARELALEILDDLYHSLKDDGYLFVGHSELIEQTAFVPCTPECPFVYKKNHGRLKEPLLREPTKRTWASPAQAAPVAYETKSADGPERLLEEATVSFEREDYARAGDQLNRLLQLAPRHVPGILLRANLYLNLGEHDCSVRECEVALQVDSFASEAYMLLGMNFQRLSKPRLAVTQLKKAAYLSPDSCIVHFQLGEAYRTSKMFDHARRAYQNALSLLPSAPEREICTYSGGFGKPALKTLCEKMIAACQAASSQFET